MNINELVSGTNYLFVLNSVTGSVVGLLPIEETAVFLSLVKRNNHEYLRLRREDDSTYLIRKDEIKEIKS